MRVRRVVLSRLKEPDRAALIEEIVALLMEIYDSTADAHRAYWNDPRIRKTVVYTLRDDDGRLCGNIGVRFFEVELDGETVTVAKLSLSLLPEHRGNKLAMRKLVAELVRERLAAPFAKLYLFATLIHPVTYKLACDMLGDAMYPHHGGADQPELAALAQQLARRFDLRACESRSPFVFEEHFISRETYQQRAYWRGREDPAVRFYVDHCPDYGSGKCIIALSPLHLHRVALASARVLLRRRVRAWRRALTRQPKEAGRPQLARPR